MINCRGSASVCFHTALGSTPSVSAAAQEGWRGRGAGEGGRGPPCAPSPGDPPRDRSRPPRARKTSGRRVRGGGSGTLCDRSPGPRGAAPALPHFLPSGPAAPVLLEPVADEFPRNKVADLTGLSLSRGNAEPSPGLRASPDHLWVLEVPPQGGSLPRRRNRGTERLSARPQAPQLHQAGGPQALCGVPVGISRPRPAPEIWHLGALSHHPPRGRRGPREPAGPAPMLLWTWGSPLRRQGEEKLAPRRSSSLSQ